MDPRRRLADARLYLCTDARRERGDLIDVVDAALSGGVDIVQLRDKGSPGERAHGPLEAGPELEVLKSLRAVIDRHGALLAVNDRADIAATAGADILHLGQDDLSPSAARRIVGASTVIGRSTHDAEQARDADADPDVDYFCVGPCWSTPTKPGRPAAGLGLVEAVAHQGARRPWFAIGGIDPDRVDAVVDAGARRAVVVRAITGADDPAAAARHLRERLMSAEVAAGLS